MIVFTCQVYSKAFYQHSHVLSDGSVITHAHPFNKSSDNSPFKKHQHTSFELYVLENVNLLFALSITTLVLFLSGKKEIILLKYFPEKESIFLMTSKGRSPPIA
ncbi:MAG: hypothetical protein ACOCWA_02855 [Bacteroidota bacterium]